MKLTIKRVYDSPSADDGYRVLVDRLWPRGITKEKAAIDQWLKEIAPSNEVRKRFHHDPAKWDLFKQKYFQELAQQEQLVGWLRQEAKKRRVTLLYAAKDERLNNAVALKEYLENFL